MSIPILLICALYGDEFKHSQPISWCTCRTCRCDSTSRWHKYQEEDYTMQFLIGLNSSFSQLRSSILSVVPLEERQRNIDGFVPSILPPASSELPYSVNAATSFYGRGRLLFSHCGRTNHTVDRCYTLHGFLQGFGRGRGKPPSNNSTSAKSVNYVDDSLPDGSEKVVAVTTLPSSDQCQQLISLLQSQLAASSLSSPSTSTAPPSAAQIAPATSSPFTSTTLFSPYIASVTSPTPLWLLDTGATHHVCCNLSLFSSSCHTSTFLINTLIKINTM